MSYQKQNFANGEVLTASQLNHIEDGIAEIESAANATKTVVDNIIDPTLSLPGKAADAKATGDAVGALKEDLEDIGIYKKEDLPAYMGGIAVNKGSYVAAIEYIDVKNRLRTINKITSYAEAFLLKAGKKYLVTVKDGYVYALQLFDSIGGVALLDFKYRSDDYKIEYDRDVYAAFMLKKNR